MNTHARSPIPPRPPSPPDVLMGLLNDPLDREGTEAITSIGYLPPRPVPAGDGDLIERSREEVDQVRRIAEGAQYAGVERLTDGDARDGA